MDFPVRPPPAAGRLLLALALWCAWASVDPRSLRPEPLPAGAWAAATAVFAWLLFRFWRGSEGAGAWLFGLLFAAAALEAARFPGEAGVRHGKFLPGAALGAYLLGEAFRPRGAPRGASGEEAACGVIGACYVLAALSKWLGSGTDWLDGSRHALLIAERSFDGPAPLQALRTWWAPKLFLSSASAFLTLAVESAGLLFLWPAARRPMALAFTAVHAGIFLLLGYFYPQWVLAVLGVAFFGLRPPEYARSAGKARASALPSEASA